MLNVKKKTITDGWDCWGRTEYKDVYIVIDENGKEIYESSDDPTRLIEKIGEMYGKV